MTWLNIIIGMLLLFVGRRLFWLFVGCVGFASGYFYAQHIWTLQEPILILMLAITAGVVGAIIAIFFQKAAIAVAGFTAGGFLALSLFDKFVEMSVQTAWLPYAIGGIIGAIVLFFVFDWALMFLSTLTGATLVVQTVPFKPWVEFAIFIALFIAGMAFQAKTMTGRKRSAHKGG